jgi:hypothetical protein
LTRRKSGRYHQRSATKLSISASRSEKIRWVVFKKKVAP